MVVKGILDGNKMTEGEWLALRGDSQMLEHERLNSECGRGEGD